MKKVRTVFIVVFFFLALTACGRVAEEGDGYEESFSSTTSEEASSSCMAEVEAESASEAEPESETEASEDSEAELELDLEAEPEPEYSSATEEESDVEEDAEVNTKVGNAETKEASSGTGNSAEATKDTSPITGDTYVAQEGDTLSSIAQRAGVSIDTVLGYNPELKDPNKISAGQVIYLTQREEVSEESDEEETKTETEAEDSETEETETESDENEEENLTIEEMEQIPEYVDDPQSPLYAEVRQMRNSSDIILTYGDSEVGIQYGSEASPGKVMLRTVDDPYRVRTVCVGVFTNAYTSLELDGTIVVEYSSCLEVLESVDFITYVAEE